MKSLAILKSKTQITLNSGFTLIEIMIVMVLMTIVGGMSLYFGMDSFHGYSYHSDRDMLVSALEHARAEAMANICRGDSCIDGKPYGVAIRPIDHPNSYVIFQTERINGNYANRTEEDKTVDALIDTTSTVTPGEVIFNSISGDTSGPADITFMLSDDTIHTSEITINKEGQITWTN